jgi:hypothetical protein
LTKVLLVAAVGLFPVGSPFAMVSTGVSTAYGQGYGGQTPNPGDLINPLDLFAPGELDPVPRGMPKKSVRKKSAAADQSASKKSKNTGASAKRADAGQMTFSQDVAPILVANCVRCHSGDGAGLKKGKLDLSTFEKLQKAAGIRDHKVISPGKPEESALVLRIKGRETPRMPQGNNQTLSADAIATIEQWVKQGAKLDQGRDPKKTIASYAASPEQMRRAQVARLPQQEVDKKIEEVGLQRWKQANPRAKPEIVGGDHFVMFSNLPRDRATSTLKVMDTQQTQIKRLLGRAAESWVEKVSIYIFGTRRDFVEFIRSVENRTEVDPEETWSGALSIPQPYIATVDPQGGRGEEPTAGKRKTRTRRGEEGASASASSDRSLNGLLTEALATSALNSAGKPPHWLALGVGSYIAAQVEPRSSHYNQLRRTAFAIWQQGWAAKANEVLGDLGTVDSLRAVGFGLVEGLMSEEATRRSFPAFVQSMLQGGEKLDESLQSVYGGTTRAEFITGGHEWISGHYGQLQ